MRVWTIVVAAGSGARFGAAKQFAEINGRRAVDRAVDRAREVSDGVVVVLPPDGTWTGPPVAADVPGGPTRAASVRAGLDAVSGDADVILVHDAARPLASRELFDRVVGAVASGADGAVPGLAITDTVKRVEDGHVVGTVEREDLVVVQTPQAFRADRLRGAHRGAPDGTDDSALLERAGGKVVVVDGDPANIKLTHERDLVVAEALDRTS